MSTTQKGVDPSQGPATRSRRALPRVASLPPRNSRSRVTNNSDVEPVTGPEELERALADPALQGQDPVPSSLLQLPVLQGAQDRDRRPSGTFHTALQDNNLQMLDVTTKIASLEAELRTLRSEMLTLRAEPKASDVIQDVRQLRVDYNTERESNSALKSELVALKVQLQRYEDILELHQGRLGRLEQSGSQTPQALTADNNEPMKGTGDARRHTEEPAAEPKIREEHRSSSRSKKAKKRREYGSSSEESNSDTDGSSSESESSSDGERKRRRKSKRHGPTGRAKGKRFEDLRELKPTNSLYKELLSYRYYRLNKTSQKRTTKQTAKVSGFIKRMELSLKEHRFDGSDPIMVLDFLSRFVTEANVLGMSEGQAYLSLPKFLRGFARDQFEAVNHSAAASEGGVTSWPEAVQYLLRSYATGAAISEATSALRTVRQRADETETEFSTRLNIAEHRCGNVHSIEERMTYFVDGLDPAIRALVARHREATRRLTFIELVQYAKAEGDAHRARKGTLRKPALPAHVRALPPRETQRKSALLLESTEDSSYGEYPWEQGQDTQDAALLLGEHSVQTSIPTTDLTDTDSPYGTQYSPYGTQESSDPALAIGFRSQLPAPRIPYQGASPYLAQRRPGWQVQHPQRRDGPAQGIICHMCYARDDHIAPKCAHPFRNFAAIVHNYEVLSPEEKALVPARSYHQAKTLLAQPARAGPPRDNAVRFADKSPGPRPTMVTAPQVLRQDHASTTAQRAQKN